MYTFSDIIKNHFLEEFTEVSLGTVAAVLLAACLVGLFIVLIYRITFRGVLYSSGFAFSLVLLSMITSLAILTVTSNVVLSLGMVGALSIVRFRTAVKDPLDTIFMFWAIVVGITSGAGLYSITLVGSLLIGILFLVINLFNGKLSSRCYLMIVRCDPAAAESISKTLSGIRKCRLKSISDTNERCEMICELRTGRDIQKTIQPIRTADGVYEVSVTAYGSGTVL